MITSEDRLHPQFNLAKELLCTLPREPIGVPLADLADDLDLRHQADVRALIATLNAAGHKIKTFAKDGFGHMVYVMKEGWANAQGVGEDYWDAVHGG